MRTIKKSEFFKLAIQAPESAFLISVSEGNVYILADMEQTENGIRIEEMEFLMDKYLPLKDASAECRTRYNGGISFIEPKGVKEEERLSYTVALFADISSHATYLSCRGDAFDLLNIISDRGNGKYYVILEEESKSAKRQIGALVDCVRKVDALRAQMNSILSQLCAIGNTDVLNPEYVELDGMRVVDYAIRDGAGYDREDGSQLWNTEKQTTTGIEDVSYYRHTSPYGPEGDCGEGITYVVVSETADGSSGQALAIPMFW